MSRSTSTRLGRGLALCTQLITSFVGAGCAFDDEPPAGATIVCASDADCPSGTACTPRHECSPGGESAIIGDVFFDPPVTRGGAAILVVRADRPLGDKAPRVTWAPGSPALALAFEGTDGNEQRLVVSVDDVAEGSYVLASIDVTDASGRLAARDLVGVSLTVDRTPPVVRNARLVDPPADRVYADRPPFDVVTATFFANEPLAANGATVRLGGRVSAAEECTVSEAGLGEVVCSMSVTGLLDGPVTPIVAVADEAGNERLVSLENIVVDAAPPGIVPSSAAVAIRNGSRVVDVAGPASTVMVSFLTTEELGQPPAVTLDAVGVPFVVEAAAAQRFTVTLPAGTAVSPGRYGVHARLVDRFGHESVVALPLPAPHEDGIAFAAGAAVCPPPPGVLCVDGDGDGFPAVGDCPAGVDLDDLDALDHPGATERPGDGKDNSQSGGDLPIDESVGVFADSEAGDDAGDGTRAAPLRTLGAALARATANGRAYVFLAARATSYSAGDGRVSKHLLGGLSPATWERTDGSSVLGQDIIVVGGQLFDHVSSDFVIEGGVLVESAVTSRSLGRTVRSSVGTARGGSYVESTLNTLAVPDGSSTRLLRSTVFGGASFIDSASIHAVDSVIIGGITCSGSNCGPVTLHHSAVYSPGAAVEGDVDHVASIASVLAADGGQPPIDVRSSTTLTLAGNDFVTAGDDIVVIANVGGFTIDDLSSCPESACVVVEGNLAIDPGVFSFGHLAPGSALADAAVIATDFGAPTSVVMDIDFDCRYADAAPDIGADELR